MRIWTLRAYATPGGKYQLPPEREEIAVPVLQGWEQGPCRRAERVLPSYGKRMNAFVEREM